MKRLKTILFCALAVFFSSSLQANSQIDYLKEGNRAFSDLSYSFKVNFRSDWGSLYLDTNNFQKDSIAKAKKTVVGAIAGGIIFSLILHSTSGCENESKFFRCVDEITTGFVLGGLIGGVAGYNLMFFSGIKRFGLGITY